MRRTVAVIAVLLVVLVGYGTLDVFDKVPGILTLDGPAQGGRMPATSPSAVSSTAGGSAAGSGSGVAGPAVLPSAVTDPALPLLAAGAAAPEPTEAGLVRTLRTALHDPALGPALGVTIRDAATGAHLLDVGATQPRIPASTTKLLTAAAVMTTLDPQARLTTTTVQGATPQDVVLVAGGDTLLAPGPGNPTAVVGHAGLGDLAAQTAQTLRANGVRSVRLHVDQRYAYGPLYAPGWDRADISAGLTGPVAMLGLSTQRPTPGHPASTDPAASVAAAFARALAAHGVAVSKAVTPAAAPAGAPQLGAVTSAPVSDVLAQALDDSDNALTESLARQAAVRAGRPTSFASVAGWVLATVHRLGIDTSGVRLVDTSGLSAGTLIPAATIGDVLTLAAGGTAPALRDVVAQLPVAGLTGTLHDRFVSPRTHAAAGIARAKTGTLTGASALAGTVVDADGRQLLFVVLANGLPPGVGTLNARAALDRLVATLASCGCR